MEHNGTIAGVAHAPILEWLWLKSSNHRTINRSKCDQHMRKDFPHHQFDHLLQLGRIVSKLLGNVSSFIQSSIARSRPIAMYRNGFTEYATTQVAQDLS